MNTFQLLGRMRTSPKSFKELSKEQKNILNEKAKNKLNILVEQYPDLLKKDEGLHLEALLEIGIDAFLLPSPSSAQDMVLSNLIKMEDWFDKETKTNNFKIYSLIKEYSK